MTNRQSALNTENAQWFYILANVWFAIVAEILLV